MGLLNKLAESEDPLVRFFLYPTIVGALGGIIAGALIAIARGPKVFWESYLSWFTVSAILLSVLIKVALQARHLFGKDFDALQVLKSILNEFPHPLTKYALLSLGDAVNDIHADINSLRRTGLKQPFPKKIQIIEALIEDLGQSKKKEWSRTLLAGNAHSELTRYWATTLDPPSILWIEFDRFFSLQERILEKVTDKRRIVVLSKDRLKGEVESHSEELQRFIAWHKENNFRLLFLVDNERRFESETKQFIKLHENEVVTDFAILGDRWVYGEVTTARQDIADYRDERLLRLYGRDFGGQNVIDNYISFYRDLWEKWKGDKWPIMVPEQILIECHRQESKKKKLEATRQYYEQHIPANNPNACFEAIRAFISNAKSEIVAVDIAPLKTNLLDWVTKKEYADWMKATMNAAQNNGCKSVRLYVLESPLSDLATRQVALKNIFLTQKNAGVNIWLASASALWEKGIPVQDFILVDKTLCFSLGWDEAFSRDTVCIEKNLEHPVTFDWFEALFTNIITSQCARNLAEVDDDEVLEYLKTLKW